MADHPVLDIIEGTEETHRGLGNLAAMTVLRESLLQLKAQGSESAIVVN